MVRETRHLWVGNLPDNIREDRIREHFKRYGRVQNVKLLGRMESASASSNASANSGVCATVAFMDIKSASKAHNVEHVLDERTLTTEYYEPAAIPSTAGAPSAGSSPAGSGYSGSSSSVNSAPAPVSTSRYHLSTEDTAGNTCAMAATAAAAVTWRGTNDSATEYCRRGNTPAAYGRTTPHHRWYASGTGAASTTGAGSGSGGAAGGESTPSTPGGATERRRRLSGSGSSRSESSSPEPSDTSRASTPAAHQAAAAHHAARRTPPPHPHQWPSTANGRPLAICVRNLPTRSTDSSLKDGLYHEYKKHGKVVWVKVVGQNADRYAVVRFKKPSDVEKALEVSQDKLFFGCKISVAPHQSCDDDAESAKPYETDIDEYHPKATRTLFIGNLEKDVTQQQLRDKFKHFGRIIEIDIKKGSGGGAGYAFCQYASISSVVEAIRAMDGEHVGSSRVKLGFGKPVATTCVWVDGLTEHTEKQVLGAVSRCGAATSVCVDRAAGAALVHFEQAAAAGGAVRELRRVAAQLSAAEPDHPRLCVDYASRECQEAFYEQLEKHGGSAALAGAERVVGDTPSRYIPSARHETLRYDTGASRSRAPSFGRSSSRTPRYNAHDHYDPADYAADRRYRVYDELGSSPQTDEATYEDRLQSVVVSPHRGHKHRRDSSTEDRKHSKERHRSAGGGSRRSRSGSRGHVSRRRHRRRRDGSGSRTSRAGTPLRDEPDAPPTEPRRPPRERPPLPMSLPLPKFAVQLLRAAPAQPRSLPPAPASPPRPPSASSSSGGSAPHSPSLEERIRSLDEKYERWSGSRAHADAPDRSRLRHRLLELDINEVKPSEVVRSLLAKRSVFDEDTERLEGARVPSPGGSPRSLAVAVPRVLRYPFPAHSGPITASATPSTSTATPGTPTRPPEPDDQDRTHLSLLDRIPKLPPVETVNEIRIRMRTPSVDKLVDMHEKKQSPSIDKEQFELDCNNITRHESKSRRNSLVVHPDERKSPLIAENTISAHRSFEHNIDNEKHNLKDIRVALEDKLLTIKRESGLDEQPVLKTSDINKFERNCFRDEAKYCSQEIKQAIKQELQVELELNQNEIFFFPNAYDTKLQTIIQEDIKPKLNHDSKLHESGFREKKEIEKLFQTHKSKEIISYNVHSLNHLNAINCSERKIMDVSPETKLKEKISKEKCEINGPITLPDDKFCKENMNCEKTADSFKVKSNFLLSVEKTVDNAKNQDESNKSECERSRHCKDRIEKDHVDKEKVQNKHHKQERNEKERKTKDDNHFVKSSAEKNEKSKSERVVEKHPETEKVERERESDKPRHSDETKSLRLENHKKDKVEKDKKRDHNETESSAKGLRREDKHKHDRTKKESDIKRETKTDNSKSRKSSRDESSRDVCRKDSTDSSASRTSHDSTKSRDFENTEIKEEPKSKPRNTVEIFHKVETEKDSAKLSDHPKLDGKIKIKTEIKEEKESAHLRNKTDSYIDNTLKTKSDGLEKQRHYSLDSPNLDSKRKERLNSCSSLPSNIGHKRRKSSQDSLDCLTEDTKKCKSERRDSKDSRNHERHKTTKFSKGHFAKIIESKTKDDKKNQVKPPDDMFLNIKENETKEPAAPERNKTNKKSSLDEIEEKIKSPGRGQQSGNSESSSESLHNNIDFLATLELRSSEEDERQKVLRKEMKEKKRIQQLQQIQELQMQQDALQQAELCNKVKDQDRKLKNEEKKKDTLREKRMSTERKSKDDRNDMSKRRNRKQVPSTDSSDSDEPMKKHSIFDIVDDEPTYISMYDKVKARSCKNMQKQEEEKRQEKIKAKFSQLKQSRAKREEKKRSSWDEDSDSENENHKSHKASMGSSSDDGEMTIHGKKREKSHGSSLEYDQMRTNDYFDAISNEEDSRNKLSRKNSRSRIMSDTSDDENINRNMRKSPNFVDKIKKEIFSDSESSQKCKDTDINLKEFSDDKVKKTSLLNLFGKSDSEDNRLKTLLDGENEYRISYGKGYTNDISSGNESNPSNLHSSEMRIKHKKKQKKYKFTFSDEDTKTESGHEVSADLVVKRKNSDKFRRHSNKKEKRKDKIRESVDTDEPRDEKIKYKKDKRSPSQSYDLIMDPASNNYKKEGKMEDIFGPLTDESDRDSHIAAHSMDYLYTAAEKLNGDDIKIKDDIKRKKEKRRKDKRHFVKDDDNSLDVDAVSKAIEARLFADTSNIDDNRTKLENNSDCVSKKFNTDHKYGDININMNSPFNKYCVKYKKDSREKKKKKKKNREDRQSRKEHHHGHHHEKIPKHEDSDIESNTKPQKLEDSYIDNNVTSPKTMLLDIPLPNDTQNIEVTDKSDDNKSLSESPSLPRITDSPPFAIKTDENSVTKRNDQNSSNLLVVDDAIEIDYDLVGNIEVNDIPMPPPIDNIVQDISEVPLPKDPPLNSEKCKQSESTSVNVDIEVDTDVKTSEDAVRSIPNLEKDTEKQTDKIVSESHSCKTDKKVEEKPRAIISQEETEDAVAALLGESFRGKMNTFDNCYEEVENNSTHQIEIENTPIEIEIIPEEDAEEMRQAVQNLNASEMEMKPDTPVSDSDILLIDTDTEEAEDTNQDAIEKLPVNIIATNQSLNNNNKVSLAQTTEISNIIVTKPKTTIVRPIQKELQELKKINEVEVKPSVTKQETIQEITSTATPVITSPVRSWTLSNNKLVEPQIPNVPVSSLASKDHNESKPTHITANIVQIKAPHNQGVQIGSTVRPIINANRVSTPYQVINQIIRPQVSSMQPPTIKIPEPHIIYQKPQGIVISPRVSNDPILLSPKTTPRTEGMTSPRLNNLAILGSSPQNINSVGIATSNTIQQRSPGQVTVVRMQQPPLSPIQTMHISPGARGMVSPNRPNSVLVQTQGSSLHFNRLPVTPVLAPISKQLNVNNIIQQTKSSFSNNHPQLIHQPKIISDTRQSENINENTKIILSPTRLHQSTNSTIMAQNRLISMQNPIHVGNINSTLQLSNKVLINNKAQLGDKREASNTKPEQNLLTPIIHVATHAPSSIIQGSAKSVVCSLHEAATVNRGHGSNVIHSINSQRLLTTNPITNVIQLDANKGPPSVLSMATIRPSQAPCKSESSNTIVVTTASLANVVMTPLLLKTSTTPKATIRLHTRSESEHVDNRASLPFMNHCQPQHCDKIVENKELDIQKTASVPSATEHITAKCETDFEELLKDNTNEIKVTNDPEKKLEINVGKSLTLITAAFDRRKSTDCKADEKDSNKESSTKKQYSTVDDTILTINDTEITTSEIVEIKSIDFVENIPKKNNLEHIQQDKSEINTHDLKDKTEDKKTCENNEIPITSKDDDSNNKFFSLLSSPNKVNEIKNLDEGDYWSAKDVNIESVIKKVESLCNDTFDEKKDDIHEVNGLNDSPGKIAIEANIHNEILGGCNEANKQDSCDTELSKELETKSEAFQECNVVEEPIIEKTTGKRGGRSGRGKRMEKNPDRVQTRQIAKPPRGSKRGRGSRAKVDKKIKNLVSNNMNNMPGDVYDFHEDSGDETVTSPNKTEVRPRLILTIKSPLSGHSNAIATSTLSITHKDQVKIIEKPKEEKMEVFVSPSANTRKSRRLQEKDIQRSTVDDVIDEVIKGSGIQFKNNKDTNKKRSARQAGCKTNIEKNSTGDTRKSPRGVKRTRDRSLSDASMDSNDDNVKREDILKEPSPAPPKLPKLAEPLEPPKSEPETIIKPTPVAPPVITTPPSNPIPIMKPPKKMISEIVKLAGVFEAAANINNRVGLVSSPSVPDRPLLSVERPCEAERLAPPAVETSPIAAGEAGDAGFVRRIVDNVPVNMMPVGATEATDARVQSPALPHRPPSALHPVDRATPVLVRGGDGDGEARFHGAYAGPASLPRGAHHPPLAKQAAVVVPHHLGSRTPVTDEVRFGRTSVPAGSPQGQIALGDGLYPHFSHHHYQMYQQHFRATQHENISTPTFLPRGALEAEASEVPTPPLELRRPPSARVPRPAHSPSPLDRHIMYAVRCGRSPPPAHGTSRPPSALPPPGPPGPPHASQVPREADSLQMLLRRYPVMWQGLLALKNDSAAVQMHFVGGNPGVAADALSRHSDGAAASLLRIAQRMRLEPAQLDQVHRKMKLENEHCILLGLPCGRDHMDVLQQSTNLTAGFITYLQRKQAAGIVNVAPSPGHHQSIYTVHIFPSCDFANENLNRIAPDLMHRVANIAHLLIVIATALG
ncbi:protein split ends isoform X2 [Pararge aegeria]|uniref:protein split ends isoform X2 n=1 Tax=Pararge aegeria TaxID=116150 RepID=UPI0019D03457|nr:protein split ends isoform X2 [Pararge aegeria]